MGPSITMSGGLVTLRRGALNVLLMSRAGLIPFDWTRMLAHELGHLMTGAEDDGNDYRGK